MTKTRKKGDTLSNGEGEQETPGTAILHLLNDGFAPPPVQTTVTPTAPPRPPLAAPATTQQRPAQTAIPPRGSIPSTSALTPPDENGPHTRKRFLPPENPAPSAAPPDKRRRTTNALSNASNSGAGASGGSSTGNNNFIDLTYPPQLPSAARTDSIAMLADALTRSSTGPRWPEQAMDIFFREFADEDMDLQIKIAEKMLTDTNKAVMFCKMPRSLRKHWIKRLREATSRMGIGN